jgi:hypothetical protein
MSTDDLSGIQDQLSHLYDIHTGHNFHPPAANEVVIRFSSEILQFIADHEEVFLRISS